MRALLDVNMLPALLDSEHSHHVRARSWWNGTPDLTWATCPLTQNGFLRIVSQPAYANPKPLASAFDLLARATALPEHEFWPDDVSLLEGGAIDHSRILSPRHLTDVYLLALAVKHGGRLVTLDRGVPLSAVRGATGERLVAV